MRLTIVHHHDSQFTDQRLIKTIEKNCLIKFVGAGTTVEEAKRHAGQSHFKEVNERKKKDDRLVFVNEYVEDPYDVETESEYGSTITHTSRMVANPTLQVVGQEDYTLEEKLMQLCEPYLSLEERQFHIITPKSDSVFEVPEVMDYWTDWAKVLQFMETPQSYPNEEIDAELKKKEDTYAGNGRTALKKPPRK
jgi:hypothetical protein